ERADLAGRHLSEARPRLPAALAERIGRIEGWPAQLRPVARIVPEVARSGVRAIRIHGDYHLGQLLRADDGYFVLDFEGEPSHPIPERRALEWAAKDVAGMIRSIDYRVRVGSSDPAGSSGRLSAAGQALRDRLRDRFLQGYRSEIGPAPAGIQPDAPARFEALVLYFRIEKLCYELQYELDHRPTWLGIPLAALEELLEDPAIRSGRTGPWNRSTPTDR
ncbi:trehalose synthase-fused probable maltokinase, partial [mine drainage metagenome]